MRTQLISLTTVGPERFDGAVMTQHLSRAAELGAPHPEQASGAVDIVTVEAHGFTDANMPVTASSPMSVSNVTARSRRWQLAGRGHQRRNVGLGVQVGRGWPVASSRQQLGGWDLGGGIDRLQIAGEATHDAQPVDQPDRAPVHRLRCPAHSQLRGDAARARLVGEGHEAAEYPGGVLELVTKAPPDGEVVIQGLTKAVHAAPPGQG